MTGERDSPDGGEEDLDELHPPAESLRPVSGSGGESESVGDTFAGGDRGSDVSELDELHPPASGVRPVAEQDAAGGGDDSAGDEDE